jgi:hypothetical protein
MASGRPVMQSAPAHPELDRLREETRNIKVTDEMLIEQYISFVYGNAPEDAKTTRESARKAVTSLRTTRD